MEYPFSHQQLSEELGDRALMICPHKQPRPGSGTAALWHEELEIKYYFNAGSILMIGNHYYETFPGDVFIINPCEPHSSENPDTGADYHYLIINLRAFCNDANDDASDALRSICSGQQVFNHLIRGDKIVRDEIEAICLQFINNGEQYDLYILGHVYLLLDRLIKTSLVRLNEPVRYERGISLIQKLAPAFALMQNNYDSLISDDALAQSCGFSKKYFCRIFKELTGTTPVAYLNHLRIEKAAILLKTTDWPMPKIAGKCGFDDSSYFGRVFRSQKNCTPLQFRKQTLLQTE